MRQVTFTIVVIFCMAFSGFAQFTSNPGENTQLSDLSGEQATPKIAICSDGSMYVSWFSNENSNYNVRLQYLDADGNAQWEDNGLLVSDEPQMSWLTDWDLTVDPDNYAVVTFQDIRDVNNNPVGYRVSPAGDMMWGDEGIMLSDNENFEVAPKVCATEAGNAIFAWQSQGDNNEVRLQKVSPAGDLLWGEGIVLSEAGIQYTAPYLRPAGDDYAYLIWHKETGPFWAPNRGLYVQKLDTDGSFMWATASEIYAPVASGPVVYLHIRADNSNGLVFSWYGNDIGTHFNAWVQHMNADGSLSMPANGVTVSTSQDRHHMYSAPAYLPETNEIVVFFSEQDLNQNDRGLYAQKFDVQGNRQWTDNGKTLIPLSNNDYSLPMAYGYMDKAICVYGAFEFGNPVDSKVQAVMLDADGNYVWQDEFIDMSTVQSQKLHRTLSPLNSGQWVAVWGDERNGNRDIYAQNILPDGSLGVQASGEGKMLGFVRDATTNLGIDMATITATNADDDHQTVQTPFGSHYSFMVSTGTYSVSCAASGYQTAELTDVVIDENQNMAYNFYLQPTDVLSGIAGTVSSENQVYPNPASDVLFVNGSKNCAIEIKNMQGQVLINQITAIGNKGGINVSQLSPGVYIYNIMYNEQIVTGKFIKK